jgi:hypothetical protein
MPEAHVMYVARHRADYHSGFDCAMAYLRDHYEAQYPKHLAA